jgi:GntR family transcriptional regulator/MocR family aminotransferase
LRELPDAALGYGAGRGLCELRVALSDYLGRVRAVVSEPDQVFIASGAAHAMSVLWQTLRERGARRVAVEDPTSPAIPRSIEQAGLEVVPMWLDEHGLDVARLDGAGVEAVAVSASHRYPTGTVLAPARRSRLIEWARRQSAPVVEHESDAACRHSREPVGALQGVAADCIAYVGTANTTLAPAVRLGWAIVPRDGGPARPRAPASACDQCCRWTRCFGASAPEPALPSRLPLSALVPPSGRGRP